MGDESGVQCLVKEYLASRGFSSTLSHFTNDPGDAHVNGNDLHGTTSRLEKVEARALRQAAEVASGKSSRVRKPGKNGTPNAGTGNGDGGAI